MELGCNQKDDGIQVDPHDLVVAAADHILMTIIQNIMNNLIKDDQSCSIRTDDGWRYTEYMFMKVITDHSEKEQLFEF